MFDSFGSTLGLSGDTLVVGAPGEDGGALYVDGAADNAVAGAGAAYLFGRTGTSWSQLAYLKSSSSEAGGVFGGSVDVSGNGVAIGSTGDTSEWIDSGAAFTFAVDPPYSAQPYCTGKASSGGCLATLTTTSLVAHPVSGAADYTVDAGRVQGANNGLLIAGLGPASLPFFGGTLCVQPPFKRGPLQSARGFTGAEACHATFSTLVNDGAVLPAGLDAGPGNSGWYQYWYRDPANGAGGFASALSNAIRLDFL